MIRRLLISLGFLTLIFSTFGQIQPSHWFPRGVGGGGAIFSPSISPFDSEELWVSCDMTPMHQSFDFGASWNTISFLKLTGHRFSKIEFSSQPNKLYTLHRNINAQYIPVVSNDGGANWDNLPNPCSFTAFRMYANPFDTSQFVLSDKTNVFFTNDEGLNYANIYSVPPSSDAHVAGVFFSSRDSIFICTDKGIFFTPNEGGVWNDFTSISGIGVGEEIVSFAGAEQNGKQVFIATTLTASFVQPKSYGEDIGQFQNLYKLSWGDPSWTQITASLPSPSDDAYHVSMQQNDTSIIYLGGRTTSGGNFGTVFRSLNSGLNFVNVFLTPSALANNANIGVGWRGTSSLAQWDHKWNGLGYPNGLTVDPNNAARIVFVDGMTVHTSEDYGATWRQAYTDRNFDFPPGTLIDPSQEFVTNGLGVTNSYWLTWLDSLQIFAGFNDLLAMRTKDGGLKWSFDFTGLDSSKINDVNMILRHPLTGVLYAAAGELAGSNSDYTDSRVSLVPGRISMSTDNGMTWQTMVSFGHAVSSISFDPTSVNRMYATVIDVPGGEGGIVVCDDISFGSSSIWNAVQNNNPPRTEGRPFRIQVLQNGELLAVYGSRDISTTSVPSNNFSNSSGVFYSTDAGVTWMDRTDPTMQKSTFNIEIDPNDSSQDTWLAFVTSNQTTLPGVYRTTDRGLSWVRIFDQAANSCTFHPTLPNEMYLCTQKSGLFYVRQTNSGSPIFELDTIYPFRGPNRVFFSPYDENEIWVMSNGNEMHVGFWTDSNADVKAIVNENNSSLIYPNPNKGIFQMILPIKNNETAEVLIMDNLGKVVYKRSHLIENKTVSMNLMDFSEGIYIIFVNSESGSYHSKMIVTGDN